jgi:RNA polymerase sigma-70 factor, ECF subfamily
MFSENYNKISPTREDQENKLAALYDEYFGKIARYVYVRIGDQNEAEDIASSVFLKALDSLTTYQERGLPMQAWLFKIAHNLVVDHLKKVSRRTLVSLEKVDIISDVDPVKVAETNVEMARVNETMKNLTEDQQEVIRLRFMVGLSSKEVGEILNKNDGAVREMQSAALEKLRKLLA